MATLSSAPAIGYINLASGVTITASSANASYPASNLSNSRLAGDGAIWRSVTAALTSVALTADLGSSKDVDVVALLGTNLSDSATSTPASSEASNFVTTEYNPGSGSAFNLTYPSILSDISVNGRNLINLPGSTYNSRYWRLTLNDAGNVNNYLKGSVFWAGPLYQFVLTDGTSHGLDESSEHNLEYVGTPGVERTISGWKLVIKGQSEKSSREIISIVKNKLRSGRLLLIPHPTKPETFLHEVIYCTITSFKRSMMPSVPILWQVEIEFMGVED